MTRQEYNKSPKTCKRCGVHIPFKQRANTFCGSSCAASFVNPLKPKRKKTRPCARCALVTDNPKFCSPECSEAHRREQSEARVGTNQLVDVRVIKRVLLEQRGPKCEICRNDTWQGKPLPMVLDHINGDWEDHQLGNLRLLCSNCDSQTPTYKAKNKGKGRHSRRERYAAGKSY